MKNDVECLLLAHSRCEPSDRVSTAAIEGTADQMLASDSGSLRQCRRGQGDRERIAAQNRERWTASNPGQGAAPMPFSAAVDFCLDGPGRSTALLHAGGAKRKTALLPVHRVSVRRDGGVAAPGFWR
jgi:hypothetical protein